jgi:hypothetical protein
MLRPLLVAGLLLAVAACASEPRRGGGFRGGRPMAEARLRRLFISPSGEPFRGPNGLEAWFARADADHDGAITLPEFEADALRFFRVLDANGDGQIDGFEIQAYEQDVAPEIAANDFDRAPAARVGEEDRPRGDGGTGGGRRGRRVGGMGRRSDGGGRGDGRVTTSLEGASRYALINEPEPVANADENLDSRVSLDEWKRATQRRFTVLDKAKTGRLTLDGLKGKASPQPRR